MFWGALILALVSVLLVVWPKVLAYPLALFSAWLALSLILQSIKLLRRRRAAIRR
jgi:hypothetical protein